MRTSAEIMADMRKCAGPNSYRASIELDREYYEATNRERKAEVAYMVKLDGKRGWFRSLLSA